MTTYTPISAVRRRNSVLGTFHAVVWRGTQALNASLKYLLYLLGQSIRAYANAMAEARIAPFRGLTGTERHRPQQLDD